MTKAFTRGAGALGLALLAMSALSSCSKPEEEPDPLPSGQNPAALVAPQNSRMAGRAAARPAAPAARGGNMPTQAQMQQP
ncbi:MAG TPA: hypothetical protein VM490_15140 [Armatimonadaceae bacterium]|nr:hypothetical protein [Armatimonadaceae bacterium]